MKVYELKQKALDLLVDEIPNNVDQYTKELSWADEFFSNHELPNYYFDTGIEVPDYSLIIGGPETDFENAKILYQAYAEKLNPVQASDLRLWGYLAHVTHWDYMNARWKIDSISDEDDENDSATDKLISRIGTRYFFKASKGKAFVRQGIARLFWSAYLTYDSTNSTNPFEYTEYFFSKQDIFSSVTERSFARNKVLLLASLKELKKYPNLSRKEIRDFLIKVNQEGAIKVLDFLNADQATRLCEDAMKEIQQQIVVEEGSTFKFFDNISGKVYPGTFKIIKGKVTIAGKPFTTKPSNLIGKKEGTVVIISGRKYVLKEIEQPSNI